MEGIRNIRTVLVTIRSMMTMMLFTAVVLLPVVIKSRSSGVEARSTSGLNPAVNPTVSDSSLNLSVKMINITRMKHA